MPEPPKTAIAHVILAEGVNGLAQQRFRQAALQPQRRFPMSSAAKIIELSADSEKGFDDALQAGIKRASGTLRNVRSIRIKDKEVLLEGAAMIYRLHLKVTFVLD